MKNRPQRGVTLLECVAATAIVGTSIVAGIELSGSYALLSQHEKRVWDALAILANEHDKIRSNPASYLVPTPFTSSADYPDYELSYAVTRSDAARKVTVTVRWTSDTGEIKTRSLVTYRCEGVD